MQAISIINRKTQNYGIKIYIITKKAVTKVLLDIVNADNRITVGEVKYFEQLQKALDISKTEIEEAKYMSVIGCLSILRETTDGQKHALAYMMLEMIRADGEIDNEEMKVFVVVCAGEDILLHETKKE